MEDPLLEEAFYGHAVQDYNQFQLQALPVPSN